MYQTTRRHILEDRNLYIYWSAWEFRISPKTRCVFYKGGTSLLSKSLRRIPKPHFACTSSIPPNTGWSKKSLTITVQIIRCTETFWSLSIMAVQRKYPNCSALFFCYIPTQSTSHHLSNLPYKKDERALPENFHSPLVFSVFLWCTVMSPSPQIPTPLPFKETVIYSPWTNNESQSYKWHRK